MKILLQILFVIAISVMGTLLVSIAEIEESKELIAFLLISVPAIIIFTVITNKIFK